MFTGLSFFIFYFAFYADFRGVIILGIVFPIFMGFIGTMLTFLGAPYYNCKKGKHIIYIDHENKKWKCSKCTFEKEAVYKKYTITKVEPYE